MIISKIRRLPELTARKLRLDVQYRRPRRIVETDINEPPRTIPLDDCKVVEFNTVGFGFEIISRHPVPRPNYSDHSFPFSTSSIQIQVARVYWIAGKLE